MRQKRVDRILPGPNNKRYLINLRPKLAYKPSGTGSRKTSFDVSSRTRMQNHFTLRYTKAPSSRKEKTKTFPKIAFTFILT